MYVLTCWQLLLNNRQKNPIMQKSCKKKFYAGGSSAIGDPVEPQARRPKRVLQLQRLEYLHGLADKVGAASDIDQRESEARAFRLTGGLPGQIDSH